MDSILMLALSATTIVKVLVDLVKLGWGSVPQAIPPAVATVTGVGIVVALLVADGQALTQQAMAQAILAGILAAGGAVGVTELSNRAQFPKGS